MASPASSHRLFLNYVRPAILGLILLAGVVAMGADENVNLSPANFHALSRQLRVDLLWNPDANAVYEIQRAETSQGLFIKLPDELPSVPIYSDFTAKSNAVFFYRIRSLRKNESGSYSVPSDWSPTIKGTSQPLCEDTLLTDVQEAGFRFFYEGANPESGLARNSTSRNPNICGIGATGMGLYNLVVGVERGFINRTEGVARALKILRFLSEKAVRFHGAFPHFIDGASGQAIPFSKYDDGADLVETAFLAEGMILLREYFSALNPDEVEIREKADNLWRGIEWDWFARDNGSSAVLMWHWSPVNGWIKNHAIIGFNECQIVYILAMASPTHPIHPRYYWNGWESSHYSTNRTQFGIDLELGRGTGQPLFFTHYSYLGMDPRLMAFHGRSYFDHFRDLCQVQIRYAESGSAKFKGYGKLWGITASKGPDGYKPFAPGPRDNGTLAPTASLSSMPYVPVESRAVLAELYQKYGDKLWGPFGFYDAFNLSRDWQSHDYLGIDVGPIAPMIENYRTGLCWKTFMKAPEINFVMKLIANSERDTKTHSASLKTMVDTKLD